VTTYTYDADGEQTATVSPLGNLAGANTGDYTQATTYNTDGQTVSVTQGGGSGHTVTPRTTTTAYDADGNPITATDARGNITTTVYNADDQPTLVTDPDGNSTLTCYDANGNKVQTVPPAGVAASSLTAASCPTAYPAGYSDRLAEDATVQTYNAAGEVTQETTPLPAGQTSSTPMGTCSSPTAPTASSARSSTPPSSCSPPRRPAAASPSSRPTAPGSTSSPSCLPAPARQAGWSTQAVPSARRR
jgi:YD repeat-containing protein